MITIDKRPREIARYSSIILDGLRILAALVVFVSHIFTHWFPQKTVTLWLDRGAHCGVITFFVLSGYVIAYTTINRNRGGLQYLSARFSRLYSVLLPALLVTASIQYVVFFLNRNLHDQFSRDPSWIRYALSGLFLNEIWFHSSGPPINGPLWSLSYEFWYYMIFGLFFYKGTGKQWLLPGIIACCITGPKILLLMPIWLLGYVAFKYPVQLKTKAWSWMLVFAALTMVALVFTFIPPYPNRIGLAPLYFSNQYLTDWIMGIFIAAALWLLPVEKKSQTSSFIKIFRKAADLTFPIYILHFPLMVVIDALIGDRITNTTQLFIPGILMLIVSAVIGLYLEKYRYIWVELFNSLFKFLNEQLKWSMKSSKLQEKKYE
jgi:peptidoglycan/LPS O-acetylase OafA/YrhL